MTDRWWILYATKKVNDCGKSWPISWRLFISLNFGRSVGMQTAIPKSNAPKPINTSFIFDSQVLSARMMKGKTIPKTMNKTIQNVNAQTCPCFIKHLPWKIKDLFHKRNARFFFKRATRDLLCLLYNKNLRLSTVALFFLDKSRQVNTDIKNSFFTQEKKWVILL